MTLSISYPPGTGGGGGGAPTDAEYLVTAANATLTAEKVVFAPAAAGSVPVTDYYAATETRNNTATLANDADDLVFSIGANEVWEATYNIYFSSASATPDFKFDITGPASPNQVAYYALGVSGAGAATASLLATAFSTALSVTSASANMFLQIKLIVDNGANAGTVRLRWAQNSATAENSTVLRGSNVVAHRLA